MNRAQKSDLIASKYTGYREALIDMLLAAKFVDGPTEDTIRAIVAELADDRLGELIEEKDENEVTKRLREQDLTD